MNDSEEKTDKRPLSENLHLATREPVTLALPSVENTWRYAAHYWRGTIRNLLIKHRLQSVDVPCYATDFHLSPALQERWQTFFGDTQPSVESSSETPYLFSQSVGTLLYTKIFSDLKFNFRHLLHVKHRTEHPAGASAYVRARRQRVACSLIRVLPMPRNRVLVTLEARITNADQQLIGRVEDSFLIRNIKPEDAAKIPPMASDRDELVGLRRRMAKLKPDTDSHSNDDIQIGSSMASGFGNVSGDMNPVHTSMLGARLFGFKKPFLQGLCVRNLVTHWLTNKGVPVDRIEMTFTNPAYVQQCVSLREHNGHYEVVSEKGRLIAFGHVNGA